MGSSRIPCGSGSGVGGGVGGIVGAWVGAGVSGSAAGAVSVGFTSTGCAASVVGTDDGGFSVFDDSSKAGDDSVPDADVSNDGAGVGAGVGADVGAGGKATGEVGGGACVALGFVGCFFP